MKRKDTKFLRKQAALDFIEELDGMGIKASYYRNKAGEYVVFFWEP